MVTTTAVFTNRWDGRQEGEEAISAGENELGERVALALVILEARLAT